MIATRQQRKTAHLAGAEIRRYFKTLLTDRMQSSETDAVSTLARQVGAGDAISPVEACGCCHGNWLVSAAGGE